MAYSCPFPTKQKYPTRRAANKSLKFQRRLRNLGVSPYRCGDHWHLGQFAHEHVGGDS